MPYGRLADRLADPPSPTCSTLPDGSVDRFCSLTAGSVGPLRTRAALGRELLDVNRSSFRMHVESVEPGGQAVNVAEQLAAFGADVTCYGHLDDPLFDDVAFETVSMGAPATVYAFNFADSDVMYVEEGEVGAWTLDDLRAAADLETVFGVDAVCCSNWISSPGMGPAFHELGERAFDRVPFVLDPGDVVGSTPEGTAALRDALAALQDTFDVVFNANRQEVRATAATLPDPPEADPARLAAIREATGIEAAVMHAPDCAVAATSTGIVEVDTLPIGEARRHTGGGDAFTGGLGFALAAGWDVELALACGNACGSRFIETGKSGSVDEVVAFLEHRAPAGA